MMHGHEESDSAIVAVKPTNKAERSAAESVERRAETKGNASQQSTRLTQSRISVPQGVGSLECQIASNCDPLSRPITTPYQRANVPL